MMLYHGTSERNLKVILKKGLLPRSTSKRRTNWDRNPSHPEAVYLTNAYAGFYANASCKGRERWAILEIDTDKLSPFAFAPDEDFLEQAGRGKDGISGDMKQRTTALKKQLFSNYSGNLEAPSTAASLKYLGNCTYFGPIFVSCTSQPNFSISIRALSASTNLPSCRSRLLSDPRFLICSGTSVTLPTVPIFKPNT